MSTKQTIAVIDSDEDVRKLMGLVLSDEGYAVRCYDRRAQLHDIQAMMPVLVVIDLQPICPESTIRLLGQIHNSPATAQVPVIVTSTDPGLFTKLAPWLPGNISAVLEKPFDLDQLICCVEQALSLRHTRVIGG